MTGNPVPIRSYVYLLVAVLILLSASAIGFVYWQEAGFRKMQEIQADYHLRTVNYCARIKEELTQIEKQALGFSFRSFPSSADVGSQQGRASVGASSYLIKKYLDAIVDLQIKYQEPKFEATVQKALVWGQQLVANQGSAEPMDEGVRSRLQVTLAALSVAADQLGRLHFAAHEELELTLRTRRQQNRWNLLVLTGMLVLVGSFSTRQILSRISVMLKKQMETEEKFRSLMQLAPDAILGVNREGHIVLVNSQAERLFGYNRDEMIGQPIEILVSERFREDHVAHRTDYFSHPHARIMGKGLVLHGLRKDGREFPAEINLSPFEHDEETLAISIIRDISQRAQLEAQLRQAQKMEAVGRLAGGVAHDFNNLLMVMRGYTELLLGRLGPDDSLRQHAEEIQKAADRASSLTRQLLALSRKQAMQPKVIDLNTVVADTEKMLRRLIGEHIELVPALDPALGRVKADPGQIEQVILNLAVNARDALPEGGKLTLESSNVELDDAFAHEHPEVVPGRYVLLAVRDTGCGMDEETRARVFEPFFTTKEKDKGTGLGLSTVYGIVKQSGGYIWVESEPGLGTAFKIYLPRLEATEEGGKLEEAVSPPLRGSETILVVEDEMSVRRLARQFLEEYGYSVLEAINGNEAIQVSGQHRGPIHLLLTDIVMPGINGQELAKRLSSQRPEMRVLYTSGFTDNTIVHHGVLDEGTAFLQKPFTLDALARKVRKLLEET